jgi:hypothetical protein
MLGRGPGFAIVAVGIVLVVIGLLVASGALSWFGRLPGDIRVNRDGFALYIPVASMLLISIILSLILFAVRRLF